MSKRDYNLILSRLSEYERAIEKYYKKFLAREDEEDLHQLRVNLRKSRAILEAFQESFKAQKKLQKVTKKVIKLIKASNRTRDLDVFLDACSKSFSPFIKRLPKEFYETVIESRNKERAALYDYLKSEKVEELFCEYRDFLDELSQKKPKAKIASIDAILQKYFDASKEHFIAYQKDHNEQHLHKIRISFKRVRYLLEASGEKEHKPYQKLIKKSKLMQEKLGLFHDLAVQEQFVVNYIGTHEIGELERVEFIAFLGVIEKRKKEAAKESKPLLKKLLLSQ